VKNTVSHWPVCKLEEKGSNSIAVDPDLMVLHLVEPEQVLSDLGDGDLQPCPIDQGNRGARGLLFSCVEL
jgi:hypothetical protein